MTKIIQDILIMDTSIFSIILLFYFYKPKDMNWLIGYRTKRSMKNEENWKFAQSYFPKKWLLVIPLMLIIQIPAFFGIEDKKITDISAITFVVISIYAVFTTEKALKNFEKGNNPA